MSVSPREDELETVYRLLDTAWSRADVRELVDVGEELIVDGGQLTYLGSEDLLRSALEQVEHDRERELICEALPLDVAGPPVGGDSRA